MRVSEKVFHAVVFAVFVLLMGYGLAGFLTEAEPSYDPSTYASE